MNPLDRLTTIISRLMGKNPDDPDVLEAVVEVVMAMREPSQLMLEVTNYPHAHLEEVWQAMIDALLGRDDGANLG